MKADTEDSRSCNLGAATELQAMSVYVRDLIQDSTSKLAGTEMCQAEQPEHGQHPAASDMPVNMLLWFSATLGYLVGASGSNSVTV